MSQDKILIVLYRNGLKASWCGYYGGEEEAAAEFKLMKLSEPGLVEVGRFPALANESYKPDPSPEEE